MPLRPYQLAAFDAAKDYLRACISPAIVEAATGAGKSHIIAELAHWLNAVSGKKVLCLAPSKELIQQNHQKYLLTGSPASIYCASAGNKSLVHDVVFGSPLSIKNAMEKLGNQFAAVVIDESHSLTPTIKDIIHQLREENPKLRVIGFTATPYRLGSGYIYEVDEHDKLVPEDKTRDPYFKKLLYRITARELIDMGFLTPPMAGDIGAGHYDAVDLKLDKKGNFDSREIEQAFEGKGRLTADIVQDVVGRSAGRMGVMFFAATRQHAREIMESLPPENSRMVDGETKSKLRTQIVKDFKDRKFKYLVNVSVFTTGFDAEHVDTVAILRATESVSLFQQIIGRGLRLHPDKKECLVLDYAENTERHCIDGDFFGVDIKAGFKFEGSASVTCECPDCGGENTFSARKNDEGYDIDQNGYFTDLEGEIIKDDFDNLIPAHFGRRCEHYNVVGGELVRCDYRWTFKECDECGFENDIAARYCAGCSAEIIDPNEKLKLDFQKMKKNPHVATSDKVLSWNVSKHIARSGNDTVRVDYTTEFRSFSVWYMPQRKTDWRKFVQATTSADAATVEEYLDLSYAFMTKKPATITSQKQNDFFKVLDYNQPESVEP